jgi:hypothetical protein
MYRIIGGDGQEYGPVSGEQIREWISQGRLNAQTQIKADGAAEWQTLGALPEFADAVGVMPPPTFAATPPAAGPGPAGSDDYDLDVTGCISRGWNLLQANMGLLIGTVLVYGVIIFLLALLGAIPLIGMIFSLVSFVIGGPLAGGLFYVFILANRGQPTAVGDLFAGFSRCFGQLFLGQLVTSLLAGLCMVPALIVLAIGMIPAVTQHRDPSTTVMVVFAILVLLSLIPMIYLSINWMFTLPLIIDRNMDFSTAMRTSWRQVSKHWWSVFALILLGSLVNFAGLLLCGVGLLFSTPIVIGAVVNAYETIFGSTSSSAS